MNIGQRFSVVGLVAFLISFSPLHAVGQGSAESSKPGVIEAVEVTIEATVEAVNHETREVTLKGPEGNLVTIEADERVKNLAQVEVGDKVTVDYVEAVTIQVFGKDEVEAGASAMTVAGSAEAGEKPAGVAVEDITVVATISGIDKEQQLVTLESEDGEFKTVKARNPENLEKVVVGDKVMISYTTALGISVTEK
ncbi:MAG: hypothetical protein ACN4GW_08165 [Desulforhopalus sp.]